MRDDYWLVGCGNMGGALLRGWMAAGFGPWRVIDPGLAAAPEGATLGAGDGDPKLVVLAVKPQVWREVVAPIVDRLAGAVVVSVMAGVMADDLAAALPGAVIVRAMPNTPAAIGQGVTGLWTADDGARALAGPLFDASGVAVWLEDEADFDALTGVSGSGPAYVFAFIEALAAGGVAAGLSAEVAMALARGTVTGAAALAAGDPAEAAELRRRVTSPGGTTAAGLAALTPELGPLLERTVAAAAARSREMAKG
jgi:pyrroline-5-carboxylate reductase